MSRRLVQVSLCAALAAAFWFAPGAASAAAELTQANPGPGSTVEDVPAEIVLVFTQDVDPEAGAEVTLDGQPLAFEIDGERLVARAPDLADGSYAISWTVTSEVDGKETNGGYTFAVNLAQEEPRAAVDQAQQTARAQEVGDESRAEVMLWAAVVMAGSAVLVLIFYFFRANLPTLLTSGIEGGLPPPGQSPPEHGDDHH
ncbi:MAG: hypothetical protein GEU28_02650 [Dehalococcoidia bacterium]|nr:hypothetical protein [Dehalococcoidia bacterium]